MARYTKEINSVTFTKEKLGNKLFETMGQFIEILVKTGYICRVYADEPGLGIYVVEFDYDNPELTPNELIWVNTEKYYIGENGADEEGEI